MARTYVKQVRVEPGNDKNAESLIDAAILNETNGKAVFKAITSFIEEGYAVYTLVFERL